MSGPVIGIDLGGTNLLVGLMDDGGTLVSRTHRPTDAHRGAQAVIDTIAEAVRDVCDTADCDVDTVDAIGIAVCGAVDHDAGIVLRTGALDWTDVPLSAPLEHQLGRPVVLENDVNAAAWGEYRRGAGRGAQGMLAAWVGTGIGGGIVLDDRLFHGPRGTAGELGQTRSDTTRHGAPILEAIASRTGMRTLVAEAAGTFPESMLLKLVGGDIDRIGTPELATAFTAGDPLALQTATTAAQVLGSALANAVTLLSIDTIVVGGGITEAFGEPWLEEVRARFRDDVFPPQASEWCRVVATALESDAGLVGAAMLAADRQ